MSKNKAPLRRSPTPRRRPPTTNYYRSGATPTSGESSPFKKKSKKTSPIAKFLARFVDIVFLSALIVGLGYSLIVSPSPKAYVNDTFYHSLGSYRDAAHRHLSSIKDRNKITFDENGLVSGLMRDYPEIDGVRVELPVFSQQPVVHIHVAVPSFTLSSGEHSYVIDANGKAIGLTANFKRAVNLPNISDKSNYPVVVGKNVLSSSDVAFIKSLLAQCAKSNVKIDSLILPTTAAELDLKPSGRPYLVKFYMPGDPSLQIGQFLAAMKQFETNGEQPGQYLDVRITGKIFYK